MFDFVPCMVIVQNVVCAKPTVDNTLNDNQVMLLAVNPLQVHYCGVYTQTLTWSNNMLSWHGTTIRGQLNDASNTYCYMAVG